MEAPSATQASNASAIVGAACGQSVAAAQRAFTTQTQRRVAAHKLHVSAVHHASSRVLLVHVHKLRLRPHVSAARRTQTATRPHQHEVRLRLARAVVHKHDADDTVRCLTGSCSAGAHAVASVPPCATVLRGCCFVSASPRLRLQERCVRCSEAASTTRKYHLHL